LHGNDRERKLRASKGDKGNKCVGGIGLVAQGKSPNKMREVINDNKKIFEPRIT
jgi:hypothetical protein